MAEKMYELIGNGIEDMGHTLGYTTETIKDVTGVSRTTITTGEETLPVTPIGIDPQYEWAKWIQMAILRKFELSQLEVGIMGVSTNITVGGKPFAWKQNTMVEPTEWATGNAELNAGATFHMVGKRTYGTMDETAVGDKFVPETGEPVEYEYPEGLAKRENFGIFVDVRTLKMA